MHARKEERRERKVTIMPREKETKIANIDLHKIEARYYNTVHPEIFNPFEQQTIDMRFALITENMERKKTCLDLGCGTGNLISRETENFDSVIGLDISREMLKICQDKFPEKKLSLILGDSEHVPFRSGSFDFVSIFSVLHHLPSPFTSLEEVYRVLNNSGRAYIDHEPNSIRMRKLLLPLELLIFHFQRILRSLFKIKKFHFTLDYSKTDIWDFRPQDLSLTLKKIGFSRLKMNHHFLYSQYFYDLPFLFKDLSFLDRLLDQVHIIRQSSSCLTATMRKKATTNVC